MVAVLAATPLTTPVEEPTVAVVRSLLLHVPPLVPLVKFVVEPTHTAAVPLIAAGTLLTVTAAVAIQPVDNAYVMVAVLAATPVTTPVAEPTVAVVTSLLLHVPPPVLLVKFVVKPIHTASVPVIPDGTP